jgi:hypothetical protein
LLTQDQASQLISLLQSSFPAANTNDASSTKVGSIEFTGHTSVNQGNVSKFFDTCSLGNWILDSGASHHICNTTQWFHSFNEITPTKVKLPNGNHVYAKYSGIVHFSPSFILTDVLCVPNFSLNLMSVSQLCTNTKLVLHFDYLHCSIQDPTTKMMIGSAEAYEGLYYLKLQDSNVHVNTAEGTNFTTIPNQAIWHFRLGHPSISRMQTLHSHFPYISIDNKGVCDVCHLAKHKKNSYSTSLNKAVTPYATIHFDIWGPLSTKSLHGYAYFLTAVDDHSRFTWTIMMKHKSEARKHVMNFVNLIENQYNSKIKIIRSDNGVEFIMPDYYASKGIIHQTTCVETPGQNGRVERKHQHLLNVGRALLFQAKLPNYFWNYAIQHATFLINRIPTPVLNNKSPFEVLHKTLPDLEQLKVFFITHLCFYTHSTQNKT